LRLIHAGNLILGEGLGLWGWILAIRFSIDLHWRLGHPDSRRSLRKAGLLSDPGHAGMSEEGEPNNSWFTEVLPRDLGVTTIRMVIEAAAKVQQPKRSVE
jgi:hypothetical protein